MTDWQPIETALDEIGNEAVLVTRYPATTRPPMHLVRWSRGPQHGRHGWRIVGSSGKRINYQPTHWRFPPEPPEGEG